MDLHQYRNHTPDYASASVSNSGNYCKDIIIVLLIAISLFMLYKLIINNNKRAQKNAKIFSNALTLPGIADLLVKNAQNTLVFKTQDNKFITVNLNITSLMINESLNDNISVSAIIEYNDNTKEQITETKMKDIANVYIPVLQRKNDVLKALISINHKYVPCGTIVIEVN